MRRAIASPATISINLFFGTGYMPPQDRRAAQQHHGRFLDQARHARTNSGWWAPRANAIAPNKRSLSSMTPTFVETPKGPR